MIIDLGVSNLLFFVSYNNITVLCSTEQYPSIKIYVNGATSSHTVALVLVTTSPLKILDVHFQRVLMKLIKVLSVQVNVNVNACFS